MPRTGSGGQHILPVEPSSLAFPIVTESGVTESLPQCDCYSFVQQIPVKCVFVSGPCAWEQHSPGSCPHGAYSEWGGESAV